MTRSWISNSVFNLLRCPLVGRAMCRIEASDVPTPMVLSSCIVEWQSEVAEWPPKFLASCNFRRWTGVSHERRYLTLKSLHID